MSVYYLLSSTSNKVILISDEGITKKHKRKMKKEKKDTESIKKDIPGVPDVANVSIGEFGIFVTLFSLQYWNTIFSLKSLTLGEALDNMTDINI